ncbi:MAG: Flp pilus assembly protein CpaB [Pseudomonadota bacterium]|jgi:pilus assembly protein CpaB
MAKRSWLVAVIAIIIGLVAVVVANAWFSGMEDKQEQIAKDDSTVQIVVAAQPLDFGTKLTLQNIKLVAWPASSIPQGAYRNAKDALADNRVALRPIVIGEPILADKVSGKDGRASLAALVPEGMRAFSIPVDAINGVAGFVLPGTMVDVLLTRKIPGVGTDAEDVRSDILLTGVQVLAVDQVATNKEGKPKVGRTATLAVSLHDAQRLALAHKMGTLSLALRKVEDGAADSAQLADHPTLNSSTLIGRQVAGPALRVVRRNQSGGGAQPAPRLSDAMPQSAPRTLPAGPQVRPDGPSMTVFRGAEPTVYPVGGN